MSSNSSYHVLAGVAALALAGTAMANTNLDGTSTGDIFLNIVDTTNHTSLLFDTGIAQASFTGTTSITPSFNLASDPNYIAWKGATGSSDSLNYSVVSATNNGTVGTVFYTSGLGTQTAQVGANIATAQTVVSNFAQGANGVTSTTTNSANLGSTLYWGQDGVEGVFATQLTSNALGDQAAIGTAMAYYEQTTSHLSSGTKLATLSTFAGMWDLTSAGILSYTVSSGTVPLPAPLMLLLSGLGLTGLLGRRGKSAGAEPGAAAA